MKINPKINKRVNESVAECRKVITEATIELLKKIGVEDCHDCYFKDTLILFQHKGSTSETIVANNITYLDKRGGYSFYHLGIGEKGVTSSFFLSLSNLYRVYEEVRKIVREE